MKTNSNTESGLQSRPEQLNTIKSSLARINCARRRANRSLDTETLLAVLRGSAPRFFELAEVVGQWVWIQFSDKQPVEVTRVLAELGFHWNRTRQAWQHPCGLLRLAASMEKPPCLSAVARSKAFLFAGQSIMQVIPAAVFATIQSIPLLHIYPQVVRLKQKVLMM